MESINYSLNRYCLLIFYFSLITAVHSSCNPEHSPVSPEVSSMKCLYEHIVSIWKSDESKTKELEPDEKPVTTESVTEPTNGPPDPIHDNKHKEVTTSSYKTDSKNEKMNKLLSAFTSVVKKTDSTSVEKKNDSELDNSITQAEGARHLSVDTYVNREPVESNSTAPRLHLEIPFTDKIFMQICAVQIAFILIVMFAWCHYIRELRAIEKHVGEVMTKAQAVAHSMAEEASSSQRYSESDVQMEPLSNNDELALMTSSSMVYCHLQNLANEIERSKPEEHLEKYLTEDFLQLIAARIAQDDFMKSNFQKLLTAEKLLQLGQLNCYQKSKNCGHSERLSSHLEDNETVSQQHCTGKSNHRDVKVNIGVQVGGQEIKIPQSKTEKREEEKEENSSD